MAKSIMHRKEDRTCYLCMKLHDDYDTRTGLQEHHVFMGNPGRKLSERYGLKIYLCFNHHTYDGGPEAIHRNNDIRRMVEKEAQKAFEKKYLCPDFREIFGKNTLDEEDRQPDQKQDGLKEITFINNMLPTIMS